MIINFKKIICDERGSGGGGSIALKASVMGLFLTLLMFVLIDFYYMANVYSFVKNQQELANRAVYAELDQNQLADHNLYIDENLGRAKFEEYITKNLELDSNDIPARNMRLVGSVVVKEFEIYNTGEIPTTTPAGKVVDEVSVYSEIEIEVKPFLFGRFGTIKFNPKLTTDVPDILLRTFRP